MLALFGRAEVRDFADVYRLAERFGKEALLAGATAADPGFDVTVPPATGRRWAEARSLFAQAFRPTAGV